MVVGVGNNNISIKTKIMVLKKGSSGKEVEELQKALGITVDGDLGPKTLKAVKDYQQANGLVIDGIGGPKTWAQITPQKAINSV